MQCPANCSGTPVPVIGGQNAQYGEESSICKSAIHSGVILDQIGGLVLIEPQRYPLNIRASFLPLMSNSISSENAPAGSGFLIKNSIKSDPICISKPIEGETLKVTASSVLEKFVEPHIPGVEPVETILNWVASHALSKSASPWAPSLADKEPWLQIDFESVYSIDKIETAGSTIFPFDFKPKKFILKMRNSSGDDWEIFKGPLSDIPRVFNASGQPSRQK